LAQCEQRVEVEFGSAKQGLMLEMFFGEEHRHESTNGTKLIQFKWHLVAKQDSRSKDQDIN